MSFTSRTSTNDRRAALLPTAHQAIEYLIGLLLAYTAIRRNGSSTAALFAVAVASVGVATLSPGALGLRRVLSHRMRRVGDVLLAVICAGVAIVVTRLDVAATVSLLVAALLLARLGFSRIPEPVVRRRRLADDQGDPDRPSVARRAGEIVGNAQPMLNRTARIAGVFVRNRRARRNL